MFEYNPMGETVVTPKFFKTQKILFDHKKIFFPKIGQKRPLHFFPQKPPN
jgi:hypothetical protein